MPIKKELTKKASTYNLTEQEYAFACLTALEWDKHSAWYIAFNGQGEAWAKTALENEIAKMLIKVKECVNDIIKARAPEMDKALKADMKDIDKQDISSKSMKETQLKELIAAKKKMVTGSREWLDAQKLIADIAGSKKSEIKEQSKTVHYYLPIKCNMCSLYNSAQKDGKI